MKVAVVILNYNGKSFLEKFLPGVIEHSKDAEIIIADNLSSDDSLAFLKSNFPNIRLVINKENGGFAKGYNDALSEIKADYYVLLNSDIEVTANWIKPCVDLLENNSAIVAVQPKVMAYHKKTLFEHAGAAGGFLDKDFFPFCQGRIFDLVEEDKGQYDSNREVFWATGACLFIRAEAYHELGGLDEDFFAHMEEIDLCWRLKLRGHQIWYCYESTIYHVGGGTLNYDNPKKTFLNFRNSLYMIAKNYQGPLFIKMFKRMFIDGIAAVLFLFKFQFKHFWAVIRSHFAFYSSLSSLLKKRKENLKGITEFNSIGLYKKNIVFKKFLSGLKKFDELEKKDFH